MTVTPLEYLKLGWKIFPVHTIDAYGVCTCRDGDKCNSPGKHGRTRHGVHDASGDENQIRAWMAQFPDTNWGLACGVASGVFAIDIDPSKGGAESFEEFEQVMVDATPASLIQGTGGGGRHIIYALPEGVTNMGNPTNWLQGVDIRGNSGHIVIEPSLHISGGRYGWLNWGHPIAEAPKSLIDAIIGARTFGNGVLGAGGFGAAAGLSDTDEILAGVKEGSRDDTLFRLACRLRRQLNDSRVAVETLVLAAAAQAEPPFPESEALKKVEQAFRQDHTDLDIFKSGGAGNDNFGGDSSMDPDEQDRIYHLTDMGNRDRFVRAFGDQYRYVSGRGWFRWSDLGWVSVEQNIVRYDVQTVPEVIREDATRIADISARSRVIRWAHDSESSGRVSSILTLAEDHPTFFRDQDAFNTVSHELACRNGMVDLRDGTIRPFVREDMFLRNTKVIYEPEYRLEAWENFLIDTTQGDTELIEYLQMAAGYTLTGSVEEEVFFVVSGPRQSGKSTYMDALKAALGGYSDVSPPETFMQRFGKELPREELVKFDGSRLILTSELPEGGKFDEAFVKRITGGDPISLRYLYEEAFAIRPQFKLWMATNHDPITNDSAMFRRIKRVPFMHTVPENRRDRRLKQIIQDPAVGGRAVLAWAVKGAIKYFERGYLPTPSVIAVATEEYRLSQDSFSQFLFETFWTKEGARASVKSAHEAYNEWCKKTRERPITRPVFIQKLRDKEVAVRTLDNGEQYIDGYMFRTDVVENVAYFSGGQL